MSRLVIFALACASTALAVPAYAQSAPANFTATSVSRQQINLSWTAVTGAATYNLYRSTTSGGEGTTPAVSGITATTYPNSGLTASQPYFYQVAAVTSSGTVGTFSAEQEALTSPTGISAVGGDGAVLAGWNAGASGVTYTVTRSSGGAFTSIATGLTGGPYTDTTVVNQTSYNYEVTALANGKSSYPSTYATTSPIPQLKINAGGVGLTAGGLTSGGVIAWGADNSTTGSNVATPATSFSNLPSGVPYELFQNQRQSTGSGLSYTEGNIANGSYALTLYFSEINSGVKAGGRVFNVLVNGQTVLTNFDIYQQAINNGASNALDYVVPESFPVTVTNGQVTVALQDVIGESLLAAFALGSSAPPAADVPPPGWAEGAVPTDDGTDADGDGPGSSLGVSLPSQIEENNPGPDLWAYNPVGPRVSYERSYRGNHAGAGGGALYSSPGLSPGWTDNYDLILTPGGSGFTLTYPNGAQEAWGGTSGTLSTPVGAPYLAKVVDANTVTMQFKDRTVFTFKKQTAASANGQYPANTYLLMSMTSLVGHSVNLVRAAASSNYEITDIQNDASPIATLLHFTYASNLLQSVADMESGQRQVNYRFTSGVLTDATWIEPAGTAFAVGDDHWVYGYATVGTKSYLNSVSTPDPAVINTGNPFATIAATVGFDATGHVLSNKDARSVTKSYTPMPGGTQVTVAPITGAAPPLAWMTLYNSGKNTSAGVRDGAGNASAIDYTTVPTGYTASPSPYLPAVGIDRNGHAVALTYETTANEYGNVLTATDWRGTRSVMTYQYPTDFPLGQVLTATEEHVTGGSNNTNGATVDFAKQPVTYNYYPATVAAGGGPAWNGLLMSVTSPKPDTTTANAATVQTTYTYTGSGTSSLGNLLNVALPGNGSNGNAAINIGYAYATPEAVGEPITVTDALNHSTSYTYDTRGNVLSMIDANSHETDYAYNFADQVVAVTLPVINGGATGALEVTTYQYPGGPVVSSALYAEGTTYAQVLMGTAPAPVRETKYNYDHEGEVTMTSDLTGTGTGGPFGPEATYVYDAQGRVTAQGDGLGQITNYYYDGSVGNLQEMSYPKYGGSAPTYSAAAKAWSGISGADSESYAYDPDQNLTGRVDGRGLTTTYTRNTDPESLVTKITYSAVSGVTALNPITLTYDAYGRCKEASDIVGTVLGTTDKTSTFDDLDELQTVTTSFSGGPQSQTMAYAHNDDGSRKTMTFGLLPTVGGAYTNYAYGYTYDAGHLLRQVNYPWHDGTASHAISHLYQPNNWLASTTMPGFSTTYTYNGRGYVTDLLNQAQNGINASEFGGTGANAMTYDTAGNRTSELEVVPAVSNGSGEDSPDLNRTVTYTYDNRDELIQEDSVPHVTDYYNSTYDWLFSYDLAYNPQSFRATASMPAMYGFNTDNQTTSLLSGSLTSPIYDGDGGPSTYSSPSNGLTGGYNGGAFSFDGENRLAAATGPSFPFTAYYDGDGMRTQLTTNNATTYYLYDDEAGGGVPVVELAYASGNATTSLQYLNGTCADGWRLRYVGGVAYVETYDPQGSIVQSGQDLAAGQSQYARATYCYDGFGGLRGRWSSAGSTSNVHQDPAGFGGQYGYYQDLQTGLEHLGARYYDGGTGRFVTRDPIGYGGGENLYAFCGNNPITGSDPTGLEQISVHNPEHYAYVYSGDATTGFSRSKSYGHTDYVIDVPNTKNIDKNIQNIDKNIKHALRFRNSVESIGLGYEDQLSEEFDYMVTYTKNDSVGDYGKNVTLYPDSDINKNYHLHWERRLAANFNYGATGAALGWSLTTLLSGGHILSIAHLHGPHYQIEQDAIEDGFWYYFQTHPAEAKADGIHIPKGFAVKF